MASQPHAGQTELPDLNLPTPRSFSRTDLPGPIAAVDVEGLLRHVIGVGGGEEDGGAGDVLRLLDAAERNRFDELPLRFADLPTEQFRELLVNLDPERGVDDPRRDAVDVDLV